MKTGRREFIGAASLVAACGECHGPRRQVCDQRPYTTSTTSKQCVATRSSSSSMNAWPTAALCFQIAHAGVRTVPLGNDIGTLWFQHLMPLASSPGNVIAGLTRHADAFLLTRFAQGIGLRIAQHSAEAHAGPDTLVMWRLDTSRNRT